MRQRIRIFILFLFVLAVSASAAEAINIKSAEVQSGVAIIQGNGAQSKSTISWEGSSVAQAKPNGDFSFYGAVPADCVGTLSDGIETIDVVLLACTPAASAAVPQTGLRTSVDPAHLGRDDGASQTGIMLPHPRFTDNGDGTVLDNLTRLIWLRNANCPNGTRTWRGALDFVAGINDGTNDCGDTSNNGSHQSDWRLPNMRELHSLININFFNPAVSNAAGTDKCVDMLPPNESVCPFQYLQSATPPATRYWSSSATPFQFGFDLGVWVVDSFSGEVLNIMESTPSYVIAVRGGQ